MNCNKIIYDKNCNIIIQDNNYDSNYAFVYILQLNKTSEITNQIFIKTSEELLVIFNSCLDGFYTIATLKISKNSESEYYYLDGVFYHNGSEIELLAIIELNPNFTGIEVTYDYYFLICKLKKCFINICYLILDALGSFCNSSKLDLNLIYKRDLIWSALNAIKYMTEMDLYEEAERLFERIIGCNGLCSCQDSINKSNCGCK